MINGKKVLALVPARGGSKSIPLKNIQPCGGKPLIAWTIEAARASKYTDHVSISTDCREIAIVADLHGCGDTIVRPADLATDEASMEGVVLHALDNLPGYDICVLLQPTSPLRTADDVDQALELFFDVGVIAYADSKTNSVVSVHESYAVPFTGEDPPRRQDRKPTLFLNGAIYAFRCDWFRRVKKFVTAESVPYVMPAERSLDVDYPRDLAIAALLIGRGGSDAPGSR